MNRDLFYAYRHDINTVIIQQWAGEILSTINYVDSVTDLSQCHKKIILISADDANHNIELTQQLVKQNNYLVFLDPGEVHSHREEGIISDCPNISQFTFLLGGTNNRIKSINLNSFYFFTLTDLNILRAQHYTFDQIYQTKSKPFKYLYLNGADRQHRRLLWNSLESAGQLECALKSYLGYQSFDSPPDLSPCITLPQSYESPYADIDKILPFKDQPRNYMSFKNHFFDGHWVDGHIVPMQYINTYFSLVTETLATPGQIFLTEKIFKVLLAGHPFIILGSPGIYNELHQLGFKTFNNIIDESFDQEQNLIARIQMITAEVQRLCQLDLDKFLHDCRDICLYNQQHYISNKTNLFQATHFELDKFFRNLVSNFTTY